MDGNGNGSTPAAPVLGARWNPNTGFFEVLHSGLTKREMFAAMSMQGILSAGNWWPDRTLFKEIAHRAVIQADALLAALNAEESK